MYAILVVVHCMHQHIITSSEIDKYKLYDDDIDWLDWHDTQHTTPFFTVGIVFRFFPFFFSTNNFLSFFLPVLSRIVSIWIVIDVDSEFNRHVISWSVKILAKHLCCRPCHHPCWPSWGAGRHEYSVRHHLGQWWHPPITYWVLHHSWPPR